MSPVVNNQPRPFTSVLAGVTERISGCDKWLAGLGIAILFVVMLVATWQRWTHPIIDHGREMNLPARILGGERLYVDIIYYYGPFAPYFNALLYRVFGIHLATLHSSGIVCAALVLAIIHWLARRLLDPWEAGLATSVVLITCAFAAYLGNYIQPYAYAALYGWTFALGSLVCIVRYIECQRSRWMFWAGVNIGATLICKPELSLLGVASAGVALALGSLAQRRWLWGPGWLLTVPALAIGGLTYGVIVLRVPWQTLVTDTYHAFSQPQMVYFAHHLNGTLEWPHTGWALIAATGMTLFASGLTAVLGLALAPTAESMWRGRAWLAWAPMAVGLWLWFLRVRVPSAIDVNPLRSAPIVLLITMGSIVWQFLLARSRHDCISRKNQILLVFVVFSAVSIDRVILNVSLTKAYTPFTIPTLVIVYLYLFFRVSPSLLLATDVSREYARRCAVALMALVVVGLAFNDALLARTRNVLAISGPRGRLLTSPTLGRPLAEAIRFATEHSGPSEYVLSLPQGTIVNFLAERPNPLREENIVPGFLTAERERDAIRRIAARHVQLILVANLLTPEYRDLAFGVDYNQTLMSWIDEHYHPVATFSNTDGVHLRFGDDNFFVRAYERNR